MAKGFKIWKTVMFVTVMCMLLALGGGLLACHPAEEEHTHNWSQTYSFDDENHWLECTECHQHTGTEPHEFDDENDVSCNVCDYVRHVHTLVWKNDGDINGKHWQEYSCEHHDTEKFNEEDHVWGDDNLCDKCGLDRTPDHVHHEIVRYDETQHWTTYDCTEHGNEKINPQSHTFTNGSKCDGCDYDRDAEHQHTLSGWIHNNDPQYHWKEYTCWHHDDEQVEKAAHDFGNDDTCDTCGYVRAHDHNNFPWAWNFDETQHWQTSTCHPDTAGEKNRAEHEFDSGVCECGLSESYLKVYNVYKTFEQAKGESEISEFTEWYASLKEQNVHHVGVNAKGDAVYYSSAEDTTGEIKYYGTRAYTVNVSVDGVWIAAKVNDGGQKKVLSLAQSSNGGARVSFIPIWEDTAGYEICIATAEDLTAADKTPVPMPSNCIVVDGKSSISINPRTTTPVNLTFNVAVALGLGPAGMLEGKSLPGYSATYNRTYYFKEPETWGAGVYKLTYDLTAISAGGYWTAEGLYIAFDGKTTIESRFTSNGKNSAAIVFKLDGTEKFFQVRFYGNGTLTGNFTLTKIPTDITVENAKEFVYPIYESAKCDISGLTAGKYIMVASGSSSSFNGYSYTIDSEEAAALTAEKLIEIKEGAKSLKITTSSFASERYVSTCSLRLVKLNSYTLGDEYKITEKDGYVAPWGSSEIIHGYYFILLNLSKVDMYRATLTSEKAFNNFTMSAKRNDSSVSVLNAASNASATKSYTRLFSGEATEYYLKMETTENGEEYPREFTLKIEAMNAEQIETNKEITATFSAEKKDIPYAGHLAAGGYILYSKTDLTGKNVKFTVTVGTSTKINGKSDRFNTFALTTESDVTISVSYTGAEEEYPTVKFVLIHMDGGTDIASTKANITASFTDTEYFKVYSFTEAEANYYRFSMQSESDLRNVTVYYIDYSASNPSPAKWISASAAEIKSVEYFTNSTTSTLTVPEAKYSIVVIANNDSDVAYPTTVNMSLKPTLNIASTLTTGTYVPYVEFSVDERNLATSYEVWLATNESSGQTIEAGQYTLVKTFNKDASWPEDQIAKKTFKLTYTNTDTSKFGNYFYWKVIAKDSTGKYVDFTKTITSSKSYSKSGGTTKVIVEHPTDFEGTIILKLSTSSGSTANSYLYGYAEGTAVKGTAQTEISIYSAAKTSGTVYIHTTAQGADVDHYTMPTSKSGTVGNDVTVTIEKRVKISVTVNLPENFQAKADEPIEVTFYKGTTTTNAGSGNLSIVEGNKATGDIWLDKNAQGFTVAITKGLDTGYTTTETKYTVTVDEGGETGSVTLTVKQRTKVDIELTVPAHFVSGEYTVEFYLYSDETPATKATATFKYTLDANDTEASAKQTVTAYLPMGGTYLVKITSPANSGYFASDIQKLVLDETTEKASVTISDRITVTANVELPGTSAASDVSIELHEKTTDRLISSATVHVTLDEVSGKLKGSTEMFAPEGQQLIIRGKSTNLQDYEFLTDAEVTAQDKTGSGTLVGTLKYSITVTYKFHSTAEASKYQQGRFSTIFLHKDGEQLESKSTNLANKQCTVTFYVSAADFESGALYVISVDYYNMANSYFVAPSFQVKWTEEDAQLVVTREIVYEQTSNYKPIEYTIVIPEEYTSQATHNILIAEPYGVWDQRPNKSWTSGKSGTSRIDVSFANAVPNEEGGGKTIKGTWTRYPECETLNFHLIGGDLTNKKSSSLTTSQNNIKQWYAEASLVSYDEKGTGHVTITIKQNIPVKISIPDLVSDGTPTTAFTLTITLKDGNTQVGIYNFTVDRNVTKESLNKFIYVLDWKDTYTATVTLGTSGTLGCTYKLAQTASECKTTDGTHIIQINVEQLNKVKVSVPNLNNETGTKQFALKLEVKDGESAVGTYTVTVPENATADFCEYLWLPDWKDTFTVTASNSDAECAYAITSEATAKTTEGLHEIVVNATKKTPVKVQLTGLQDEVRTVATTLSIKIKGTEGVDVCTRTVKIPAGAETSFVDYIYLDSWQADYSAEVEVYNQPYMFRTATFSEVGGAHVLTIKCEPMPHVTVVMKGFANDAVTKQFTFSYVVKDDTTTVIASTSITVIANATNENYWTNTIKEHYIKGDWKDTFKVEITQSATNDSDYIVAPESCEFTNGDKPWEHIFTITVKEQPRVTITVNGLIDEYTTFSEAAIQVFDKEGETKKQDLKLVKADMKEGNKATYHFKTFEGIENGVTFKVDSARTTVNTDYLILDCTQSGSDNSYQVTVNIKPKLHIEVKVNGFDSKYTAGDFNLKYTFDVGEEHKVLGNIISVPKGSGSEFSSNIILPAAEWNDQCKLAFLISKVQTSTKDYVIPYDYASVQVTRGADDHHYTATVTVHTKIRLDVSIKVPDGGVGSGYIKYKIYNPNGDTGKENIFGGTEQISMYCSTADATAILWLDELEATYTVEECSCTFKGTFTVTGKITVSGEGPQKTGKLVLTVEAATE